MLSARRSGGGAGGRGGEGVDRVSGFDSRRGFFFFEGEGDFERLGRDFGKKTGAGGGD